VPPGEADPTVTQPAIVVEDYSFWFKLPGGDRALALEDVSFEIEAEDYVLILGTSGSGKSTLALNLVGILPDYFGGWNQGRILVQHPEKGLLNRRELSAGERFSIVNLLFQNPEDQIVTLTVEEEIGFALENYLVDVNQIHERIDRALDLVGIADFRQRSTIRLSGGEKQRVALAAMLAMEPRVLILDEPTSNLDPAGKEQVLDAVARVRERSDVAILIVEHEVDEVFDSVRKVLLVDQHHVLGPFTPREFMREHGLDVRDRMGLWIPQATEVGLELERHAIHIAQVPLNGAELVAQVRPAVPAIAPSAAVPAGGPASAGAVQADTVDRRTVIEIRDLSFSYPTKPDVLRNVSLDIRTGELLAIVGQNGSGKSTLAAQLNGILRPTSGQVLVDGKPTTSYKFAALAKRVAYIFQVPEKQFITNTVYDEMAHSLRAMRIDEEQIKERVATVLEQIGLTGREHMSPYMLSHGQKRRLSVACMVIAEPEVIILDEPTFGQDYRQARRIMTFMRDLADNGGAVAFITHDMRLVAEYADRCVAMCEGEAILEGSAAELFTTTEVLERTRLKAPPVMAFCEQLLGTTVLTAADAVDRIVEAVHGRSRTGVQGH
jgi:energy-coupling factor transport system ATP-binding protein